MGIVNEGKIEVYEKIEDEMSEDWEDVVMKRKKKKGEREKERIMEIEERLSD